MSKLKSVLGGASGDSFLLIFIRMITLVLGLLTTRVLSGHFSLQEYGTYSQITLLVSSISSLTILGMMDGINFFFCKENDENKRNAYISTIFFLQYSISALVSLTVLICMGPISRYFGNEGVKSLIIFAAVLPVAQNTISLLQIMFIAIGKAKQIGIRNLIVSLLKLLAIVLACYVFDSVAIIFLCQLITDILQIVYFYVILRRHSCKINILKFDKSLIKEILVYCIPMAMFTVIKSLNRDADKYVISFFTDTETLAIYTNASKLLPFDIIMTSFCTVLLPYITRYIANKKFEQCRVLYKSFLELAYISTTILAMGAICVAPELMRFLYTEKYSSSTFGVAVFILYIIVDIVSVLNITLILSAAGKAKTILFTSIGAFVSNIILNIFLFIALKEVGPAVSTLIVAVIQGIVMISLGAKVLGTNGIKMFEFKYLLCFLLELAAMSIIALGLRNVLVDHHINYLVILFGVYILFVCVLLAVNIKRLGKNIKIINSCKVVS